VPFSSYSYDYGYRSVEGIQIVEFDLARGTLAARGMISNTQPVTRTRAYGDRILATSDYALQVVDASDLARPRVIAQIPLVWNIQDAVRMGGADVQLYSEGWEGATGIRVVRPGANDWDRPLAELAMGMDQMSLFPDGNTLYVNGMEKDMLKLLAYDLTDPSAPRLLGSASRKMPADAARPYYGAEKGGAEGDASYYYYYSLSTVLLDNNVMCVIPQSGSDSPNLTMCIFDISVRGQPQALPDYIARLDGRASGSYGYYYHYAYGFTGAGKTLYFTGWDNMGGYLGRIDMSDPRNPARLADAEIKGQLAGAEPDGSAVYTTASFYRTDGDDYQYGYTFNIYKPDGAGLRLAYAVEFNGSISSVQICAGKAFLTINEMRYYYGYDILPGTYGDGVKGDSTQYHPPVTTLMALDLRAGGAPVLLGTIGMDGYASLAGVDGTIAYISGEGMLAAYNLTDDGLRFAGALAMRGYVQKLRPFEGGALVSEGLYGTETLDM